MADKSIETFLMSYPLLDDWTLWFARDLWDTARSSVAVDITALADELERPAAGRRMSGKAIAARLRQIAASGRG